MKRILFWTMLGAYAAAARGEEKKNFLAALGGVAILSGDAQTNFGAGAVASSYAPQNGAAFNFAGGRHFSDWLSVQGNYIWNRNDATLSGVTGNGFYAALNRSRQHQAILDGMLYFRPRSSRIRPYLSTGIGLVRASRRQESIRTSSAPPRDLPETEGTDGSPALRVAVGIDLLLENGWGFRYSFSESLTSNLFSRGLVPPGNKKLMNFQNLWGVVKYF